MSDIDVKDRRHEGSEEAMQHSKVLAKGPSKPWEIDIDVYLDSVDPLDFSIDTCLPQSEDDSQSCIEFNNAGRNGFTLNFRLYDNTGANPSYVFPDPPGNPNQGGDPQTWALWSSQGEGCPPPGYADQWDQFTAVKVKDKGTTLEVTNLNQYQSDFGYTLRVTNDGGASFVNLDPGGTNNNGNSAR